MFEVFGIKSAWLSAALTTTGEGKLQDYVQLQKNHTSSKHNTSVPTKKNVDLNS